MWLREALAIAERGLRVLPTGADAHTPLLRAGAYAATTDPETIERWAQQWPGANLAIAAGPLVVIDLDVPAKHPDNPTSPDGIAAWRELAYDAGEPVVMTPSGGEHHWFTRPSGLRVPCGTSIIAPGIDQLSGPGIPVPIPPSVTHRGGYSWLRTLTDIPPIPRDLLALALRAKTKPLGAGILPELTLENAVGRLRDAATGNRNDTLNTAAYLAGRLVQAGKADRQEAQSLLVEAALALGLGLREALATVNSGLAAGLAATGVLPVAASQEAAFAHLRLAVGRAWPGRTGTTDRRIYIAHCLIALRAGQESYNADVRTLAELAGVGHYSTAARANVRLVDAGIITLTRPGTRYGFRPGAYALSQVSQVATYTQDPPTATAIPPNPSILGVCCTVGHDAWRYKGLGPVAGQVWDALRGDGAATVAELVTRTGRGRSSVYRALESLAHILDVATGETAALVTRSGATWTALDVDLDTIAKMLHVDGERTRQHAKHEREREAHSRSWQEERTRRALGTLPIRQTSRAERERGKAIRKRVTPDGKR